jgi:hypothetical protein
MKKRTYLAVVFVVFSMQILFGQETYGGFEIAGSASDPLINVMKRSGAAPAFYYSLRINGSTLSEKLLSEYVMATLVNLPSGLGADQVIVEKTTDGGVVKYFFCYPPVDGRSSYLRKIGFYYTGTSFTLEVLTETDPLKQFIFDVNDPAQRLKLDYLVSALVKLYKSSMSVRIVESPDGIKIINE